MKKTWGLFLIPILFLTGCSQTVEKPEPTATDETLQACLDYVEAMETFSGKADNPVKQDVVDLDNSINKLVDYNTNRELGSLISQFAIYTEAFAKWDPPMTLSEKQEMVKIRTQLDDYCAPLVE